MAAPLIAGAVQLAVRATPWVMGYFITKEVTDTIDKKTENGAPIQTSTYKGLNLNPLGSVLPQPTAMFNSSSPNAQAYQEGFGYGDLLKLAAYAGAGYIVFKSLQEGRKLLK